ncbi:MAG: DUF3467 domain-containing protein [Planctomycetaceae bacterium]|nr:DUF3467 domain-containing protein [Planctomycetaceae bacterium]
MARKSEDTTPSDSPAEEKAATAAPADNPAPAGNGAAPQQSQITIDDAGVTACYANFCRVSSTPEELILDLGLNPQPLGGKDVRIPVGQRIILNHYTAKRLLNALSIALQRHEQAFGVLETDFRKRVKNS